MVWLKYCWKRCKTPSNQSIFLSNSAADLFKYRQGLDKSIPQRGGEKDYMPDGSWLQEKKLENVNLERHQVLAEPRVQRRYQF